MTDNYLATRSEMIYAGAGDLLSDTVDLSSIVRKARKSSEVFQGRMSALIHILKIIDRKITDARLLTEELKNMTATELEL